VTKTRSGLIAALDIGTTKICCLIGHAQPNEPVRIAGIGHHAARGIRGGAVIDMDAAQTAILTAVSAAEERCGERIERVVINISGGDLASRTYTVEVPIAGREVIESDLLRASSQANALEIEPDRDMLHCIPVGYAIDDTKRIQDPRGMFADRMSVTMHMITARSATLRNLANCIQRCHLEIASAVAAPYASGLSCLVEDEIDLGVTLVDMGGGTTTIAVFYDGEIVHTDSIPVGGAHVTSDIARGLSTPLAQAERMKTLYGSAIPSPSDERELIDVPLIGEENATQPNHVPRSLLNGIIRPRIEETFELVRSRMEVAGVDRLAGRRLVLTGGASQLHGARELASQVLEKQVRMGKPMKIAGIAEANTGPAFATSVGLLRFAVEKQAEALDPVASLPAHMPAGLGRIGQWFRENF